MRACQGAGPQTIVMVTVEPFLVMVPAAGSEERTVPKNPPRMASSLTVNPAPSRSERASSRWSPTTSGIATFSGPLDTV